MTICPSSTRAEDSAANDADFLMMNQYFGAWHGPREALGPGARQGGPAVSRPRWSIISELGFPGIFAKTPAEADPMRVSILREQMPLLAQRDWIAGAILWCYQDYKSRRYFWPGQEQGYLEHGIVDPDRQRKPSYFAWQELNEPARLDLRWAGCGAGRLADSRCEFTPNDATELPYIPLRDYQLTWQLVGAENRAFASGVERRRGEGRLPSNRPCRRAKPGRVRLVVKLLRPGRHAWRWSARSPPRNIAAHDTHRRPGRQGRAHHGRQLRHWRGAGACLRRAGRRAGTALQLARD